MAEEVGLSAARQEFVALSASFEVQLILIDTPGVFAPKRRLDRAMVAAAWNALDGADAIVHVVDAAAHAAAPKKPADGRAVEDSARI